VRPYAGRRSRWPGPSTNPSSHALGTPITGLGSCSGGSQQVGDDIARALAPVVRDTAQRVGIVAFERQVKGKARRGVAWEPGHVLEGELGQFGIEIPRLGVRGVCRKLSLAHRLSSTSLRSTAVDSQPVTTSQVSGSSVSSMTSVSARPPSVRPMRRWRSGGCDRSRLPRTLATTTWRLRGTCSASSSEMLRAPSLSSAVWVARRMRTIGGTGEVYRVRRTSTRCRDPWRCAVNYRALRSVKMPSSWIVTPSALIRPPARRSQMRSQCSALTFLPPVSGYERPSAT
jgi:hypothetical protein